MSGRMDVGADPEKPGPAAASAHPARRLPGDLPLEDLVDRIIRVDHAGEHGASRIYDGQLAVLGGGAGDPAIGRMAEQERRHLAAFERLVLDRRARPTLLHPLWNVAGFALGVGTALLGRNAAMACTVAVEEVIEEHYARQIERLGEDEPELRALLVECRRDEIEHRDAGLAEGAREAPAYELLTGAIKLGSRAAIWLSERL